MITTKRQSDRLESFSLIRPNGLGTETAGTHLKPKKHAYLDKDFYNALTRHQPPQKPKRKLAFWERLQQKNKTKNKLCVLLSELDSDLSEKLRGCASRFETTTCGEHITERKMTFHCGNRICPFCSEIRAKEKISDYLPKAEDFFKQNSTVTPCHLVITQKHYQNELLSDAIKRLLTNFRKLIRRKFWKEHVAGGIYTVEFTIGTDGLWHAHLHCFVFRSRYFHYKQFQREWLDVTKDSIVFNIKRIDDIYRGIREVIKYISKPLDVDKFGTNHLRQVLDLKGTRLFGTFGQFRTFSAAFKPETIDAPATTKKDDTDETICHCGEPLHAIRLNISEQIEFEKYIYDLHSNSPPIRQRE